MCDPIAHRAVNEPPMSTTPQPVQPRYRFFLGGYDLEMQTIAELLNTQGQTVVDKHLAWGAKASDYATEIAAAISAQRTPVLIELALDIALAPGSMVIVDHHAERAGQRAPTSLEQILDLLGLPASAHTRHLQLVAANDRGHVQAMQAMGATLAEMQAIRAADRAAQGITAKQEAQAQQCARHTRRLAQGTLTVAQLTHNRTAALADRLHQTLGGPGYDNLLVLCPDEVNFFGHGSVVQTLSRLHPGSWWGGNLPAQGFWGINSRDAVQQQKLTSQVARACENLAKIGQAEHT